MESTTKGTSSSKSNYLIEVNEDHNVNFEIGHITVDEQLAMYSGLEVGSNLNYKVAHINPVVLHLENDPNVTLSFDAALLYVYDDGTFKMFQNYTSQVSSHNGDSYEYFYFRFLFYSKDDATLDNNKLTWTSIKCGNDYISFKGKYDQSHFQELASCNITRTGKAYKC